MKKLILVFATFLYSSVAVAQVMTLQQSDFQQGTLFGEKFEPFFGFSFGYMNENEDLRTEGMPINAKVIGSFFPMQNWVMDAGVGLLTQSFSNSDKSAALVPTLEINPRYRFRGDWQAGPHLKTYMGDGDKFGSSTNLMTTFLGVQGMKELYLMREYRSRVGVSFATDIGIPNEVAYVTTIELQIAMEKFFGQKPVAQSRPAARPEIAIEEEVVVKEIVPLQTASLESRDLKPVLFDLGQNKVGLDMKGELAKLAEELKSEDLTQGRIQIIGHGDAVGDQGLNLRVSRDRARSVRQALLNMGVPEEKIQTLWVGKREAAATPNEFDRKVEIKLQR